MCKVLGSLCVVLACSLFSLQTVLQRRDTIRAIDELSELLTELSRSIRFALVPLPELIGRLYQRENPPAQDFLAHLQEGLSAEPAPSFNKLWADATEGYRENHHLPDSARYALDALGAHLGENDYETEANRLQSAAEELSVLQEKLSSSGEKQEKVTRSMGLLLGVFVVIVLL